MKFRKSLGMAIRNARHRAGKTSIDVEVAGVVSRRALSSWETGAAPPNIENLKNFADFLGIKLSSIIKEAEISDKTST